jgi:hypothetical protein
VISCCKTWWLHHHNALINGSSSLQWLTSPPQQLSYSCQIWFENSFLHPVAVPQYLLNHVLRSDIPRISSHGSVWYMFDWVCRQRHPSPRECHTWQWLLGKWACLVWRATKVLPVCHLPYLRRPICGDKYRVDVMRAPLGVKSWQ